MSWVTDILNKGKDTIYSVTPADNVMNIAREFGKPGGPDWKTIGKNLAGGAFDVAAFALPGASAIKGGRAVLPALAKGFAMNTALNTGIDVGLGLLPGATPAAASSSVPSAAPNLWGEKYGYRFKNPNAHVINNKILVTNASTGKEQPYEWTDQKTGFKYQYNPMTGLNEVVGTVKPTQPEAKAGAGTGAAVGAPPKELLALQAALQQQYDAARIAKQSEAERAMNQIARARTQGSIAAESDLRRAGMSGRGQQIDLGTYLAEAGYGASPAMGDVAQQYIQEQEAANRAGILSRRAGQIASLAEQEQATRDALRMALDQLRQQETTARAQASLAAMQNLYGGI